MSQFEHITPHRLWTYAKGEAELNYDEQAHVFECEDCRNALAVSTASGKAMQKSMSAGETG